MAHLSSVHSGQHEQKRHQFTIEAIATDLQLPIEEVAARYESILLALSASAKVKDYLPVLIAKMIRRQYKNKA